jgi:hypothetical protein
VLRGRSWRHRRIGLSSGQVTREPRRQACRARGSSDPTSGGSATASVAPCFPSAVWAFRRWPGLVGLDGGDLAPLARSRRKRPPISSRPGGLRSTLSPTGTQERCRFRGSDPVGRRTALTCPLVTDRAPVWERGARLCRLCAQARLRPPSVRRHRSWVPLDKTSEVGVATARHWRSWRPKMVGGHPGGRAPPAWGAGEASAPWKL